MPPTVSAKFSFQSNNNTTKEVRRVPLPHLEELCYFNVLSTAQRLFSIPSDTDLTLRWCDEDGDVIELSSEIEMTEYLSYVRNCDTNASILLKLSVVPAVSPVKEQRALHEVKKIRPAIIEELKQVQLKKRNAEETKKAHAAKKAILLSLRERQDRIEAKLVRQRLTAQKDEIAAAVQKPPTGKNTIPPRHYVLHIKDKRAVHAIAPNTPFKHRWIIQNDSQFSVKHGMQLKFTSGERMCADDYSIPIGPIKIGGKVEVEALLLSPNKKGSFSSNFQCTLPSGARVGPQLTVYTIPKSTCWSNIEVGSGQPKKEFETEPYTSSMFRSRVVASVAQTANVEPPVISPRPVAPIVSNEELWKHQLDMITAIGFGDIPRIIFTLQKHCEYPRQKPPFFTADEMQEIIADLVTIN